MVKATHRSCLATASFSGSLGIDGNLRTVGWRLLCITTFDFIMLLAVGIKHGSKQLLNVMTTDGMTFG
jgi:hypothetical protein